MANMFIKYDYACLPSVKVLRSNFSSMWQSLANLLSSQTFWYRGQATSNSLKSSLHEIKLCQIVHNVNDMEHFVW